jgi:Cytochrome c554 and c-prime
LFSLLPGIFIGQAIQAPTADAGGHSSPHGVSELPRSFADMPEDRPATTVRARRMGMSVLLLAIVGVSVILIVKESRRSEVPGPSVPAGPPSDRTRSTPARAERIADYVGAAACRECHVGPSALFARSGHRRTLWPAAADQNPAVAWLNGKTPKDPEVPDVVWSYQVKDGRLVAARIVDGRTESFPLDYGLGSGKHGVTFVALRPGAVPGLDPPGLEHRLSYFADGPSIAITPGQARSKGYRRDPHNVPAGRPMAPDQVQKCFKCHATLTSTLAADRLELSTLIPNVSCERCHGPGRAHIEAARHGQDGLTMPLGQEGTEPWVEVDRCGECHRVPRTVASSSINTENLGIVRFQGVGVSMSACYAKGQSGLRCTTCHDPHDRASSDHAHYEAACLSCHRSTPAQKACPVSPAANCVGCHMPRREVPGDGIFTDHWIRKPDPAHRGPPKGATAGRSSMIR